LRNASISSGGALNIINGATVSFNREITGFSTNVANMTGGAINIENSLALFNTDTIYFIWNTAASSGGAIYADNNAQLIFTSINNQNDISVYFENNKSSGIGGAIYAKDSFLYFSSHVSVYFTNNISSNAGSAIGLFKSSIIFESNVTMSNSIVTRRGGSNALIYADSSSIVFNGANSVFSGTAGATGKAITALNGSLIEFNGTNLTFEYFNSISSDGGVFYSDLSSTISFASHTNITARGNVARNGGFMKYDEAGIVEFYGNMTFTENTALSSGGALYIIRGSTLVFGGANTTFDGNKSSVDGGAVYIDSTSFVDFSSTALTANNNKAVNGGFMSLQNRDMIFYKDVSMSANQASKNGGALIINNSTLTFEKTASFSSNKSTGSGGAIYAVNSIIKASTEAVISFSNNISSANGGALYLSASTIIFNNSNTQFMSNLSKDYGGALYMTSSSYAEINGSIFYSSANAAKFGGAIYIKGSSMSFKNEQYTVFDSNIAQGEGLGGAIYAENALVSFNSEMAYFQNNKAENHGGAVYVAKNAVIDMRNTNLISNTAGLEGGGIYVADGGILNYSVDDNKEVYIYQNVSQKASIFSTVYYNIPNGIHIAKGGVVNFLLGGEHSLIHIIDIISSTGGSKFNVSGKGSAYLYSAADIYDMTITSGAYFYILSQATFKVSTLTVSGASVLYLDSQARMFVDHNVFLNDYSELDITNGSFIMGQLNISSNAIVDMQTDAADLVYIDKLNSSGTIKMEFFANSSYDQISAGNIKINADSKLNINTNLKNRDYRRKYFFLFSSNNEIEGAFARDNINIEDIYLSSYAVYKLYEAGAILNDFIVDYGKLFKNQITIILDGDAPVQTNIAGETVGMSFNQREVAITLDKLSASFDEDGPSTMSGSFKAGDLDYIISVMSEDMDDAQRREALSEISPYFIANIFLSQSLLSVRNDIYARLVHPGDYGGTYGTWANYQGGISSFDPDPNSISIFRNSNSGTIFGMDKFSDFYQLEYGFYGRFNTAYPNQGYSNATVETYSFGLYGAKFEEEIELRTVLGIDIGKFEINRSIYPFARTARSNFTSLDADFDIEASYKMRVDNRVFRPFAGFYTNLIHQPEFEEKEANSLNMQYKSDIIWRSALRSGVATNGQWLDGDLNWNVSIAGDYILWGSLPQLTARLQDTDEYFEYRSVDLGNIFLELYLGVSYAITSSISIEVKGNFKGAGNYQEYRGDLGIRYFLD
jgi:predicted outer membrane repeat protein